MKAGTAQKMILNMLSTGAMIKLGKVYGNLMVDVKSSNKKLEERARRIVMTATSCTRHTAIQALEQCQGHAKTAIVMVKNHLSASDAAAALQNADGYLRQALQRTEKEDN